jgi:AraC-like DNA-binding protein
MEEDYTRNRNVSFYARALGVSIRTLDRRLLTARSVTARGAISVRTLLEAKRMLTRPGISIKVIASELGFEEPQNFTRFFRTLAGCSPSSFREAVCRSQR